MGTLDILRQRIYGRTFSEQKKNVEAEAWETPRGKGASAAGGKDGIAREQFAAKRLQEMGVDRIQVVETHTGGRLSVNPLGRDEQYDRIAPGVRYDEQRQTAMKKVFSRRDALRYLVFGAGALGGGVVIAKSGDIGKWLGSLIPGARAAPGAATGGAVISPADIDAKRIGGVRHATEFDTTKHAGTNTDPWSGTAIQAAMDDLPIVVYPAQDDNGSGGIVFLSGGWFVPTATIQNHRPYTNVWGFGHATYINYQSNMTVGLDMTENFLGFAEGHDSLRDFRIGCISTALQTFTHLITIGREDQMYNVWAENAIATGAMINSSFGKSFIQQCIVFFNNSGTGGGIRLLSADTLVDSWIGRILYQAVNPLPGGTGVGGLIANNKFYDFLTGSQFAIYPYHTSGWAIVNNWFSGHPRVPIQLQANDCVVEGNVIDSCGTDANNTYDMIVVENSQADGFGKNNLITGNRIRSSVGNLPRYGMRELAALAAAQNVFRNNHVTSIATAAASILSSTSLAVANFGYNPVGLVANPFDNTNNYIGILGLGANALTNAKVYTCVITPLDIFWTGGTVTAQTKNGTAIPQAAGSPNFVHLEPGDTYSITFSVTPTTFAVFAQ